MMTFLVPVPSTKIKSSTKVDELDDHSLTIR